MPLDIRKELLERELSKLGFRKAHPGGTFTSESGNAHRQAGSGSSHPQADASEGSQHAD